MSHLFKIGAAKNTDIQDAGEGTLLATAIDPFGNLLGVIENPQFKAMV